MSWYFVIFHDSFLCRLGIDVKRKYLLSLGAGPVLQATAANLDSTISWII